MIYNASPNNVMGLQCILWYLFVKFIILYNDIVLDEIINRFNKNRVDLLTVKVLTMLTVDM